MNPSAQGDPWQERLEVQRRLIAAGVQMFVIIGHEALANPLGVSIGAVDERRFHPAGTVMVRIEDVDCALATERQHHAEATNKILDVHQSEMAELHASYETTMRKLYQANQQLTALREQYETLKGAAQQTLDGWPYVGPTALRTLREVLSSTSAPEPE